MRRRDFLKILAVGLAACGLPVVATAAAEQPGIPQLDWAPDRAARGRAWVIVLARLVRRERTRLRKLGRKLTYVFIPAEAREDIRHYAAGEQVRVYGVEIMGAEFLGWDPVRAEFEAAIRYEPVEFGGFGIEKLRIPLSDLEKVCVAAVDNPLYHQPVAYWPPSVFNGPTPHELDVLFG